MRGGFAPTARGVRAYTGTSGGGGGALNNGDAFTITGTGFGSKATAAPTIYDDTTGTNPGWDYLLPNGNDSGYQLGYRNPSGVVTQSGNGVALPHAYVSKYLCGCHYNSGATSFYDGYNVGPGWDFTKPSNGTILYCHHYFRADPNFYVVTGTGNSDSDGNFKTYDYSGGFGAYENTYNWYINYAPDQSNPPRPGHITDYQYNDDAGTGAGSSLYNPDNNSHNAYWDTGSDIFNNWVKVEVAVKIDTGSTGFIKIWEDNVLVMDYAGRTDGYSGTSRSWMIGGYARNYGSTASFKNNWRYFTNLALDFSPYRVVVTNNATYSLSTVVEYQPADSWSSTSIHIPAFKRGKLPSGTGYVWVFTDGYTPTYVQTITIT